MRPFGNVALGKRNCGKWRSTLKRSQFRQTLQHQFKDKSLNCSPGSADDQDVRPQDP